jgi:hypothetical protein
MASVVDLNLLAHLSYLSAHAFAMAGGICCDSRRSNSGLCSGSDFKTAGMLGAVREVGSTRAFGRILRDVSAIICRARRVLELAAMVGMGRWCRE